MNLTPNMGTTDRYIRGIVGLILTVYAAISLNPIIAIPVAIITYTVATRWCFMYQLVGLNTGCHIKPSSKKRTQQYHRGLGT